MYIYTIVYLLIYLVGGKYDGGSSSNISSCQSNSSGDCSSSSSRCASKGGRFYASISFSKICRNAGEKLYTHMILLTQTKTTSLYVCEVMYIHIHPSVLFSFMIHENIKYIHA